MKKFSGSDLAVVIQELAAIVGSTYGPNGGFVGFSGEDARVTKDGVSVAKLLIDRCETDLERLAAKMLYDACRSTVEKVGDGTTTTALLVGGFVGGYPALLHERLEEFLGRRSSDASREDLYRVALAATNGNEVLSDAVSGMVWEIGPEGHVEARVGDGIRSEVQRGYVIPSGIYHPRFLERPVVSLENPYVAVVEQRVEDYKELLPVLRAYSGDRPLVLVVGHLEDGPLQMLVNNRFNRERPMPVYVVRSPSQGRDRIERLEDLCAGAGTRLFARFSGAPLDEFRVEDFGWCSSVVLSGSETRFVFEDSERIDARIELLREQGVSGDRLSSLMRGVGLLYLGAPTETEFRVIEDAAEDAVLACQAALRGGVIPGGGVIWREFGQLTGEELFLRLADVLPEGDVIDVVEVYLRALETALSVSDTVSRMKYIV